MPGAKTLSRADRLLRQRKFSQVISLLESQVFLYRDNFTFYQLLGTACLYVGDFGGAYSYLQRAQQIKPGDTRVELGLAAVHLRRREIPEALAHWLAVLDRDPANHQARRGLALVRDTEDTTEFITMAESGKLQRYFPRIGFAMPRWVPMAAAGTILAVAGVLVAPLLVDTIGDRISHFGQRRGGEAREGMDVITGTPLPDDLTDFTGEFRYVYTDAQIEQLVGRVGELFNSFRDNLAQREANRVLLSNASPLVKERMRVVASYFRTPTFVDFNDNFAYDEVAAEPWLYAGCHVRWSGQTSNINVSSEAITFTLLVGYEAERVLEGTIPVVVPFTADVQPGPVELIGEVVYRDGKLSLTATSIRRLAPGGRS
ncbi:MAG: tetratricopeptide repeat protein [Spirochaetota bacterium]